MLRRRLLNAIDVPLPVLFIEAVPGAGKRTLIDQWHAAEQIGTAETRVVIDARRTSSDERGYLRTLVAAVARGTGRPMPLLEGVGQQALDEARAFLRASHRTASLAVIDADYLDAAIARTLLALTEDHLRLVLTGIDLSELIELAHAQGVHFTRLDDRDLACTSEETGELMRQTGILAPDEQAIIAMRKSTRGHPGSIVAAARTMPVASASGRVSTDRVLANFLASAANVQWPSAFTRFVLSMMQVPRFSAEEATIVTGNAAAPDLVYRIHLLGLGRMSWHPGLRARMFTWDETIRTLLTSLFAATSADPGTLHRDIADAAIRCGDAELAVSALVELGELDDAERLLDDCLGDLTPSANDALWRPVERLTPDELTAHPGLLCIRLRADPTARHTAGLTAAAHRVSRMLLASLDTEPDRPFAAIARALELVRICDRRDVFAALVVRAHELLASSTRTDAASGTVSDLLLLTDSVLRGGDATRAAAFAGRARLLIRLDREALDPSSERALFAGRVELLAAREQGRNDPADAPAGSRFLHHEADTVAGNLAAVWGCLDANDLEGAKAELLTTMANVEMADDWPELIRMRAWIAALQGHLEEAQRIVAERPAPAADGDETEAPPTDAALDSPTLLPQLIGITLHDPGAIPLPSAAVRDHRVPRIRHATALLDALKAVRAGQPTTARALLDRAIDVLPKHGLSVAALARASAHEVRQLTDLLADHPLSERLNLASASAYQDAPNQPVMTLSDRECQILLRIDDGATNEQIAGAMHLSPNTVKFHRANLMRKLGAHDRTALLETARLFHLLS